MKPNGALGSSRCLGDNAAEHAAWSTGLHYECARCSEV